MPRLVAELHATPLSRWEPERSGDGRRQRAGVRVRSLAIQANLPARHRAQRVGGRGPGYGDLYKTFSPLQSPQSFASPRTRCKPRHRCPALSGLGMFLTIEPRALPWAGISRPFGPAPVPSSLPSLPSLSTATPAHFADLSACDAQAESAKREQAIQANLRRVGYGG